MDDEDNDEDARRLDGYLCACRVPSSDGDRPPEWKVGREKVLVLDVDAKLVRMGERGEYCLIERLRRREGANEKEGRLVGTEWVRRLTAFHPEECLLRLTTFRVKYGDDGELIVATAHRDRKSVV